jgi:glycosyltransferase involved in cell wall biosynthesis
MPAVLVQDYKSSFEVVLVNDNSTDDTKYLIDEFKKAFKNINHVLLTQEAKMIAGKKFPLSMGIKSAKYEIVLLTDADCVPATEHWIKKMQAAYTDNIEIVLGYGAYRKKPGFLNKLIRFETFHTALQYLTYALSGNPYMGVGRNLSYKRSMFFANKGFASHMHLMGGDDDLFVNENATKTNVAICIHREAHTLSKPKKTWKEWFWQKKRHHLTARYYKAKHQSALALYPFSFYLFYLSIILSIVFQYEVLIFVCAFGIRALFQMLTLHLCGLKLNEKTLGMVSPLLELIHRLFVYPVYLTSTIFMRKRLWK